MLRRHFVPSALLALLAGAWLLAAAPPANAGCGCDHPPPAWAPVMPPFAAPGQTLRLFPEGFELVDGEAYLVEFDGNAASETVIAAKPAGAKKNDPVEYLDVVFPAGVRSGPASIRVSGPGVDHTYPSSLFTAMQPLLTLPSSPGAFMETQVEAAVTGDGTLLLPVNVRHLLDDTQLVFQLDDLPFQFDSEDVVIYNTDGIDLTLFTLAVDGQTEMQWGSYYGWEVEDDTGLYGVVYDTKVQRSSEPDKSSDLLTYWRHEFHTYANAHLPGGTHTPDENDYHPDGSLHINHGHLVLAISGLKRSANSPDDPSSMHPLQPGRVWVNVQVKTVASPTPVEPDVMSNWLETESSFGAFDAPESHFDEFEGMDSQVQNQGGSGGGGGGGGGGGKNK
jgi:hypothetical protein